MDHDVEFTPERAERIRAYVANWIKENEPDMANWIEEHIKTADFNLFPKEGTDWDNWKLGE